MRSGDNLYEPCVETENQNPNDEWSYVVSSGLQKIFQPFQIDGNSVFIVRHYGVRGLALSASGFSPLRS